MNKVLLIFLGIMALAILSSQSKRLPLACLRGGDRSIADYTTPQKGNGSQDVIPETYDIISVPIKQADDQWKPGDIHSKIFHHAFNMTPQASGISRDVLRVVFEKRAEIVGILVSVDHSDPNIILAEFEARINSKNSGYGLGPSDALIHTSYACRGDGACRRNTDEHIWFGKNSGIELCGGDWIAFGAWMSNAGEKTASVHPEFIIYYRWLE